MRYTLHPLTLLCLFLLVFFAIGTAVLQFRFTSSAIKRTSVDLSQTQGIHPLDAVLLDNIAYLSRRNTFDPLFVSSKKVTLSPFSMQSCQTTQGEFNAFAQWSQFANSSISFAHPQAPAKQKYQSQFLQHKILGRLEAPVTGVNWYQAYAYCKAAGGRLPSSDEWEAAASGKNQRIYPWGNTFIAAEWKYRNPLLNVVQKCGEIPQSNTPEGIANMGGSVSEWVTAINHRAQLRGGNALNKPYQIHALNLVAKDAPANFASQFVGFRCAFDSHPKPTPWGSQIATLPIAGGEYTLGTPAAANLPLLVKELDQSLIDIIPLFRQSAKNQTKLEVSTYEITVAQYARFLRDPMVMFGLFANSAEPAEHSYIPDNWQQQKHNPNNPVVGISWWDASAFARWVDGRLPTLDEWNQLFSGSQPRLYPWGDSYIEGLAIVREKTSTASLVGVEQSLDQATTGVFALAGNASEWTSSVYYANQQQTMVIKGGNFLLAGEEAARMDYVARAPAYHRSSAIGFRVIFN